MQLDLELLRLMRTRAHTPAAERCARALCAAGECGALWIAVALGAALTGAERHRGERLRAAAATAGAFALNWALKQVVRRPRPRLEGLAPLAGTVSGLSYPSAHATTSFTAAALLSRTLPAAPLYATAIAIALARPYLGVHYPSDVAAGAALGTAVARLLR